jgi:hypothetical protein
MLGAKLARWKRIYWPIFPRKHPALSRPDRLEEGRAFRLLNMLDDFNREGLDIEEAQHFATQWLWTSNNNRPNMGIGGITPAMKLKMAAYAARQSR